MASRLRQEMAVDFWPRVVGPEVAHQTVAGPVRDRVLLVRTANPVLAYQLTLMERDILLRYRGLLGGTYIRRVHPQIGEVPPAAKGPAMERPGPASLPPAVEEQLAELAVRIPDPDLSGAFLRSARAWALARAPSLEEREQEWLDLLTGETWPTAAEVSRALTAIEPARRQRTRERAAELLREKILARLKENPREPGHSLRLRGDLRRLALIGGCPLTKATREMVKDLLGQEAVSVWPEEE